jgi:hypothetical protein
MKQIKSPTNLVWIIGRIQVNSAEDGRKVVVPLEKKFSLSPLSSYGKTYNPPKGKIDSSVNPASPNDQVENMSIDSFFNFINRLMIDNPPSAADSAALASFAGIGVGPGKTFTLNSFDTATQAELKNIPKEFIAQVSKALSNGIIKPINGWSMAYKNIGNYGTNYLLRAMISHGGLGANLPEDAIYPSCTVDQNGDAFDGTNKYIIHFEKGQTPPVHAFWSLTMYDQQGYLTHNPIHRYAIGDRSNLKTNADGSIDIYIQNTSPGKNKESNWLPSPSGKFNLLLRLYWPQEAVISGNWNPPPVKKAG